MPDLYWSSKGGKFPNSNSSRPEVVIEKTKDIGTLSLHDRNLDPSFDNSDMSLTLNP